MIYQGRYDVDVIHFDPAVRSQQAITCNCSICHQKGFIYLIVPPQEFSRLQGVEGRRPIPYNGHTGKHTFCCICSIDPCYRPHPYPWKLMSTFPLLMEMYRRDLHINLLTEFAGKKILRDLATR